MIPPSASDGQCLRQLFTKPESWVETRSMVKVLGYADHQLNRQFKDDELRAWLPMIERWGLKLGLEVGAVKPWGTTGQKTFEVQRKMWDRFQSLGGRIHAMAMDEPLCCVRKDFKKPDAYAVEERLLSSSLWCASITRISSWATLSLTRICHSVI